MASYWGFPILSGDKYYQYQLFLKSGRNEDEEEGEILSDYESESESENGEISDDQSSQVNSSLEDEDQREPQKTQLNRSIFADKVQEQQRSVYKLQPQNDIKEEGAISSDENEVEEGETDEETTWKKQAISEVSSEILAKGQKRPLADKQKEDSSIVPMKSSKKESLQQIKAPEIKKPAKPLRCYSEKDVDYRALWKEQLDASDAPSNHPFFQLATRNVKTKPYCDLWESEEKKDCLYYKPGTWDNVKDIPRLTDENLSKLSISEAKQFVTWLLAERKVANAELQSLRRRIWAETDRCRRFKAYLSGEKKLPANANAPVISEKQQSFPTMLNSEGYLTVTPAELKRVLQGYSKMWMNEETSELLRQKQRVYARMKKRNTEYFKNKYKELERICKAEVKKAKQQWESMIIAKYYLLQFLLMKIYFLSLFGGMYAKEWFDSIECP